MLLIRKSQGDFKVFQTRSKSSFGNKYGLKSQVWCCTSFEDDIDSINLCLQYCAVDKTDMESTRNPYFHLANSPYVSQY